MVVSQSNQLTIPTGENGLSVVAAPALTLKEILLRYAPYLAECRTAICRDLTRAPMGATLVEYFERGKMLRPLLLFAASVAVGSDPTLAIPAAQALELLHGASLIHDDIIDGAKERRGRSSLHLLVGIGPAVVLGDYLILRSYAVLGQVKSSRVLEALQVLSRCAEDCCRGQAEELMSEDESTEDSYFSVVRRKTASPFVAAAKVGGILGDGRAHEIDALGKFAMNVGISFQIRDDELDLADDSVPVSASKSQSQNWPSIPIIYLKEHGSKGAFEKYRQIQKDGAARSELITLLRTEGIVDRLEAVKKFHLNLALEAAQNFRNSGEMAALASHAIHRNT